MDELQARVTQLEQELVTTQRERDDENRQKRQLHLVYMMTVEQLALAVGLQTIEGKSTQDLIEMATNQRKALEWYAEDMNYLVEKVVYDKHGLPWYAYVAEGDVQERARKALEPATAPADAAEGAE